MVVLGDSWFLCGLLVPCIMTTGASNYCHFPRSIDTCSWSHTSITELSVASSPGLTFKIEKRACNTTKFLICTESAYYVTIAWSHGSHEATVDNGVTEWVNRSCYGSTRDKSWDARVAAYQVEMRSKCLNFEVYEKSSVLVPISNGLGTRLPGSRGHELSNW